MSKLPNTSDSVSNTHTIQNSPGAMWCWSSKSCCPFTSKDLSSTSKIPLLWMWRKKTMKCAPRQHSYICGSEQPRLPEIIFNQARGPDSMHITPPKENMPMESCYSANQSHTLVTLPTWRSSRVLGGGVGKEPHNLNNLLNKPTRHCWGRCQFTTKRGSLEGQENFQNGASWLADVNRIGLSSNHVFILIKLSTQLVS